MAFRVFNTLQEPHYQRQPEETLNAYSRFCTYREQERGKRSLAKLAESLGLRPQTIEEQAKAQRWKERAAAWDAKNTAEHEERIAAQAEKLAESYMAAATEYMYGARSSLREELNQGTTLDPDQVTRWSDAAIRLGQAAQKAQESTRAVYRAATAHTASGGTVSAWEAELPELDGLSPDQQRERFQDMVSGLARFDSYEKREQGGDT